MNTTSDEALQKPIARIGLRLCSVVMLLCAVPAIYSTTSAMIEAWSSRDWPTIEGTVSSFKAVERESAKWKVTVRYQYVVEGQTYISSRVRASDRTVSTATKDEMQNQYGQGQIAKVFYSPNDPQQAFLEPGPSTNTIVFLALSWIMLPAISVGLWIAGAKRDPDAESDTKQAGRVARRASPQPSQLEEDELVRINSSSVTRWIDAATRAGISGVISFVGVLVILQEVLMQEAAPPERAGIAAMIAVPVALVFGLLKYTRQIHSLLVRQDAVVLGRGRRTLTVSTDEILGLVAVSGLSFEGGDMIVWKKLVLIPSYGPTRTLAYGPTANAQIYQILLQSCTKAIGIPHKGEPETANRVPNRVIVESSSCVQTVMKRNLFKLAGYMTGLFLMIGVATVATLAGQAGADFAEVIIWLIAGFVGCVLLGIDGLRQFSVMGKLKRVVARIRGSR